MTIFPFRLGNIFFPNTQAVPRTAPTQAKPKLASKVVAEALNAFFADCQANCAFAHEPRKYVVHDRLESLDRLIAQVAGHSMQMQEQVAKLVDQHTTLDIAMFRKLVLFQQRAQAQANKLPSYIATGDAEEKVCNFAKEVKDAIAEAKKPLNPNQTVPWQQAGLGEQRLGLYTQQMATLQMASHLMEYFETYIRANPEIRGLTAKTVQIRDQLVAKQYTEQALTQQNRELTHRLRASCRGKGSPLPWAISLTISKKIQAAPRLDTSVAKNLNNKVNLLRQDRIDPEQRKQTTEEVLAYMDEIFQLEVIAKTDRKRSELGSDILPEIEAWLEILQQEAVAAIAEDVREALTALIELHRPSQNYVKTTAFEKMRKAGFTLKPLVPPEKSGNMSSVYLATRITEQGIEQYVFKQLNVPISYFNWARANYGEHTALLNGPFIRIVGAFDADDGSGVEAVILEYVPNAKQLDEEMHSWDHAKKSAIFKKILEGIKILHKAHYIHKDLKPTNILVEANGNIRIVDQGMQEKLTLLRPFSRIYGGTPWYMAPEIVQRQPHDQYADIYSLGVIAYQVFANVRAPGKKHKDDLQRHCTEQHYKRIQNLTKIGDEHLRTLIGEMLSSDPRRRPSAEAILARLTREQWHDDLPQRRPGNDPSSL